MLTGPIRTQIDQIWQAFWNGGVSNPLSVIEQITYLLFIKRLDDLHTLEENKARTLGRPMDRRIFPEGIDPKGKPFEDLRWSRFKNFDPRVMMEIVDEHVFPFLRTLGEEGSSYGRHMKDARLGFSNAGLLSKLVDLLDKIPMDDRDTKGDLYEYMLGKIASAGTMRIEVSNDNITWRRATADTAVAANTVAILTVPVMTRYHRVVFVTGASLQTAFMLNTSFTASQLEGVIGYLIDHILTIAHRADEVPRLGGTAKRTQALMDRLEKAARRQGLHIKGDGDGYGIPYEGRNRGKTPRGKATENPALDTSLNPNTRIPADMPDAIIGRDLGDANNHPDYVAAKSGDWGAARRLAQDLVSDDMVNRVRSLIGDRNPLLCPVISVETTGRNKSPQLVADVLANRLGLTSSEDVVQINKPHRTSLSGVDRLFATPMFGGTVAAGRDYLLVDDAITQGGTFAALSAHIRANGGKVLGAVALTGKQYSAKLALQKTTLDDLRGKYGDLEQNFRRETGYGFDDLTESEARYITKLKYADAIRDRLFAQRG